MIKKLGLIVIGTLGLSAAATVVRADDAASMAQADVAYAKRDDISQDKSALTLYVRTAQADPKQAVEAYWKASRAAWWLGEHDTARAQRLQDYQLGMDYAQKAVALDPNSAEGHFWLGANEGSYGDAKGVMKSLSMVKPIRHEMGEVIRINDQYNGGSAYQILGVVDYKVPGIVGGNKSRAEQELQKALSLIDSFPEIERTITTFDWL